MTQDYWESEDKSVRLFCADCLDILPILAAGSVDAIITDLPYGTTACSWDTIIPFELMWKNAKRMLRERGIFITTASQPFTSLLITSNLDWFRYECIWDKKLPTGHLDANRKPLKRHENILIFSANGHTYNPQMSKRGLPRWKGGKDTFESGESIYHKYTQQKTFNNNYYPTSILEFSNGDRTREEVCGHPTQKPVSLYKYLALTFSNEGETIMDFTMGSGTTGVACVQLGRKFIGIEIEPKYFEIAKRRIQEAQMQIRMNI